jgi:hypothetical protein
MKSIALLLALVLPPLRGKAWVTKVDAEYFLPGALF